MGELLQVILYHLQWLLIIGGSVEVTSYRCLNARSCCVGCAS